MYEALQIVKLIIILLAPLWGAGMIIIPIAVIVSAVMNKEGTIVWKSGWILATLLLYFPAYAYGILHFKNMISKVFTVFTLVLLLATAGGTIYFNYDRADGDVVEALMLFFEKPTPPDPNDPFRYGNYLEE